MTDASEDGGGADKGIEGLIAAPNETSIYASRPKRSIGLFADRSCHKNKRSPQRNGDQIAQRPIALRSISGNWDLRKT